VSPRGQESGSGAPPSPPPRPRKKKSRLRALLLRPRLLGCAGILLLAAAGIASVYVFLLSREIRATFEGRLWTNPTRIYSGPMRLHVGQSGGPAMIQTRLDRCGYTRIPADPRAPGQYRINGGVVDVYAREFMFPGDPWPRRHLRFVFRGGRLATIVQLPEGRGLRDVQLEPEPLAAVFGKDREERTVLPLAAYPKTLVNAVLAAEDQRFFSHHGVDPLGVLRALWQDARTGQVVQGGSTITQQTVKNLYLTSQRTLGRKVREAVMALILDASYSKERILEVYLNEIYLGQRGSNGVCGFGEAAKFYFGKDVQDLDLSESAMLAGLIRAPAVYNPIAHPDRASARKNLVVEQMREQGRVTKEEASRATARMPAISRGLGGGRRAPFFIDDVTQDLAKSHSGENLAEKGLRVVTTLDGFVQDQAEQALARGLEKIERDRPKLVKRHKGTHLEGCLIALKPDTGEVLAMVGGRGYATSQFNRATQAHRQPGSLFKPFVYATGFETGRVDSDEPFTPATILEDEPFMMTIGGREWSPHNYDEDYRGTVSAREALEGSLNVPTVHAAIEIGLPKIVEVGEAAGMGSDLKAYPSLALGAQEVVPLDAAAAFTIFANGGSRVEPYTIAAVLDDDGKIIQKGHTQARPVISPQAAYLTLDLMRGVVNHGTAGSLRGHGIGGDVAGKTGTTNDKRDAWFIGVRPNILALVWVGYDDMTETTLTGAEGAVPIWEDFMRSIGEADSDERFERPEGIAFEMVDPETGGLATGGCHDTVEEMFIEDRLPGDCPIHADGVFKKFWRRLFPGKERQAEAGAETRTDASKGHPHERQIE